LRFFAAAVEDEDDDDDDDEEDAVGRDVVPLPRSVCESCWEGSIVGEYVRIGRQIRAWFGKEAILKHLRSVCYCRSTEKR
jgi:hypothetical protein